MTKLESSMLMTEAVRGPLVKRATSPKWSPSPSVLTVIPAITILNYPCITKYIPAFSSFHSSPYFKTRQSLPNMEMSSWLTMPCWRLANHWSNSSLLKSILSVGVFSGSFYISGIDCYCYYLYESLYPCWSRVWSSTWADSLAFTNDFSSLPRNSIMSYC
jgi:hypothetical protein